MKKVNLCLKSRSKIGLFLFVVLLGLPVWAQAQQPVDFPVTSKNQAAIIDSVTHALNKIYVFPETAKKMETLVRQNLKEGKYKKISQLQEFTEILTRDLQSVSHDKHLRIQLVPPPPSESKTKQTPEDLEKQRIARFKNENYGFQKLEILPGNIGYLDLRMFAAAEYAGATAIAAMNFLANSDAIIFDLRQNGGGSPSMIQLISSYFFEEPVHLNSFYIRKSDTTHQFWTQSFVTGPKMVDKPVYILTSNSTFSGAEEFTYNFKNMKRGTILGETTGGGAHPVEFHIFASLNVGMSLPFGRAINPISKTNWEGTGVTPDIALPADKALLEAQILALKNLAEKETDDSKKQKFTWYQQTLQAEKNPVSLTADRLQDYAGNFGPRKIWVENGNLNYQRTDRPPFKLIPMGNDLFGLDGLAYFRIQFLRDKDGLVTILEGHYDNGMIDQNAREK